MQQQALRLKGMVNLLTLSVAQTQASLDHIALLQQSPAVREAAGLTEQAEAMLVDSVLAQVDRIQQMLGGVPGSAASSGMSGASGVSHEHAFSRAVSAAGQDVASMEMDARRLHERRSAHVVRHGKVPNDPVGQQSMRQSERDMYRPKNPSPPAMLIGYPVQPGSGAPSASGALLSADPASSVAAEGRLPEGVTGQGSGKGPATRPMIEYLDEAPAMHVPGRNPA